MKAALSLTGLRKLLKFYSHVGFGFIIGCIYMAFLMIAGEKFIRAMIP